MTRLPSWPPLPKFAILTLGLILVLFLGVLDFITGPELSFSVFYLLPISLVTLLTTLNGGILTAFVSAVTWMSADMLNATPYSHPLIPYWNAVVRLLVFLVVVFLGSALKELNQKLENRVRERTALLEEEVIERKKVEGRLQEYAKRLEILHEIDQAILAAESLEAVAYSTIRRTQNVLHCDSVSFILLDFDSHQLILFELPGEKNSGNPLKKGIPMDTIPHLNDILEIWRDGDLSINNETANSPVNVLLFNILRAQEYPSLMIIPIRAQDELIGSLNLLSHHRHAFSPEHQEIGREIANQLGIAINQARMLNQLRADQENLQALSQRLLDVQESERRDIARELHDEIGQALTSIMLTLEMGGKLPPEALAGSLQQTHALVLELMERVSKLSLELRPALLDDFGLLPALLWHLDRYGAQTNIQVLFKHSGLEGRRFAPEIETAAFRIVQEALTNVARHARVSETRVTVWYDQNTLGIQVEDEGQGFETDSVLANTNTGGLLGMKERAHLLRGKLTIETARGTGTRLLAELPTTELEKGQVTS